MVDVAEYILTVENESYVIEVGDTPVTTLFSKSGVIEGMPVGTDTVAVVFATQLTGALTDYTPPIISMVNLLDSFPQDLIPRVSSFSLTGFTVKLNAPVDTGNYKIAWMLPPRFNP